MAAPDVEHLPFKFCTYALTGYPSLGGGRGKVDIPAGLDLRSGTNHVSVVVFVDEPFQAISKHRIFTVHYFSARSDLFSRPDFRGLSY